MCLHECPCVWLPFAAACCYTLFYLLMMPAARLVCQRPSSNFPYFRTPLANFLLFRPNSIEYGNSKTTTLLPSAKCTRPLFRGRTGCGGRPSGWHDIVTCQRLVFTTARCQSLKHFYCFIIAFLISSSLLHSCTTSSFSSHVRHTHAFLYRTACQEHSYLICTPSSFFLLLTRPRTPHCRSPFLQAFLLLSGDTELNPGPTNFTRCTLNIRSILHPFHSTLIVLIFSASL